MQRMEEDAKYIPRSAKATDFKITLSAGAKEDEERVSFLEQQIQQAKDSYESSLKSVIEDCIALEIQAAKKKNHSSSWTYSQPSGRPFNNYKEPAVMPTYRWLMP